LRSIVAKSKGKGKGKREPWEGNPGSLIKQGILVPSCGPCDLLNDSRGSLLGELELLCKMGHNLKFGHGFFGHFWPPVEMEFES